MRGRMGMLIWMMICHEVDAGSVSRQGWVVVYLSVVVLPLPLAVSLP